MAAIFYNLMALCVSVLGDVLVDSLDVYGAFVNLENLLAQSSKILIWVVFRCMRL
jgi:hypothetical protein